MTLERVARPYKTASGRFPLSVLTEVNLAGSYAVICPKTASETLGIVAFNHLNNQSHDVQVNEHI
jgi:hypothetical protein